MGGVKERIDALSSGGDAPAPANGAAPVAEADHRRPVLSSPRPAARGRGARRSLVVLIDPRPLTRACTSILLERCAREFGILPLASPMEVLEDHAAVHDEIGLIILSLGAARVGQSRTCEEIRLLNQALPNAPVIVLSDRDDVAYVMEALRHGVRGYIPTTLSLDVAIEALRLVRAGGVFVPASVLSQVPDRHRLPMENGAPDELERGEPGGFTLREREVLALLQRGKPNKIIAHELGMQESTVKVHVRHIMRKLRATNRTQAAFLAQRRVEPL